jgi:hypothetical protein
MLLLAIIILLMVFIDKRNIEKTKNAVEALIGRVLDYILPNLILSRIKRLLNAKKGVFSAFPAVSGPPNFPIFHFFEQRSIYA